MAPEFSAKNNIDEVTRHLTNLLKILKTNKNNILSIKIRPLKLKTPEKYVQQNIPGSYYKNLFNEWFEYRKAYKIKGRPDSVFIQTALETDKRFPHFKAMVISHKSGPEIIVNDINELVLKEKFSEIVEYVSEFIETLLDKVPDEFNAFCIEERNINRTKVLGIVTAADTVNGPDLKVRQILSGSPSFKRQYIVVGSEPEKPMKPPLNQKDKKLQLLDSVKKTLKKGGKLSLGGFGTFSRSKRKARIGRNPQTGKEIKISVKPPIKFSKSTIKHAKPPIKIVSDQIESVKDEKYIVYEIFFGTNRKTKNKNNWNEFYGADRNIELEYGLCKVSIPIKHKTGELERPNWFTEKVFGENPKKHFVLLGVYPEPGKKFLTLLKSKIKQAVDDEALIFIHGYNVSFAESMRRTAQLGYDLSFRGIVLGYSWPSKGTKEGYITDMDSAKLSSDYLKEFLKLIISIKGISKLHIIAHSMGNVVLTEALIKLRNENIKLPEINQVILAAPDIDKDVFEKVIAPNILLGPRYTLYASSKDRILVLSKKIRSGYDRIGEGGKKLLLMEGIETVDASSVDTDLLGHGYFSEAISLINDIHGVLNGEAPIKRMLIQKEKIIGGKKILYWKFPNTR